MTVLLVAPQEPDVARLREALDSPDRVLVWVRSREAAANVLDRRHVDALVTRLNAPRIQGLALLELTRQRNPEAGAVLLIEPDEEERATGAMQRGVFDFQRRPWNAEKIVRVLQRIGERQQVLEEISRLHQKLDRTLSFPSLVGNSSAMSHLRSRLRELAPLDAHLLLVGEDGTGKSLVAAILHQHSPRSRGPFIRYDCAALSARRMTRRIFGSPAPPGGRPTSGLLAQASTGTLYLEQVTALPLTLQARIAEVLRTGQLRPHIDTLPIDVHPRVISSTQGDPEALLERGLLDEGLLDLIGEERLELPPLRYRRRDISALARHFLAELGEEAETGKTVRLERPVLDKLAGYDWPGNVRELKNTLRELFAQSTGAGGIGVEDLPEDIRDPVPRDALMAFPLGTRLDEAERHLILQTLKLCGGNREKAAGILGIGVRTLYRKLQTYRHEGWS